MSNFVQYQEPTIYITYNNTFVVSPIYTFSWAGNKTFYTPIQGTNREKYFNNIIFKRKKPTLARNKHLSVHFFSHTQLGHPQLYSQQYRSREYKIHFKLYLLKKIIMEMVTLIWDPFRRNDRHGSNTNTGAALSLSF